MEKQLLPSWGSPDTYRKGRGNYDKGDVKSKYV